MSALLKAAAREYRRGACKPWTPVRFSRAWRSAADLFGAGIAPVTRWPDPVYLAYRRGWSGGHDGGPSGGCGGTGGTPHPARRAASASISYFS
jgi:hypothetical protein